MAYYNSYNAYTRARRFNSGDGNDVGEPVQQYMDMDLDWCLITDLLGGTPAMRLAGSVWLPKEQNEKPAAYLARLSRTFLHGGFKDAITKLVAKPFSKPVTIKGDTGNEMLDEIAEDATLVGQDLTQLAKEMLEDAAAYGKTHLVVDFPNTGGDLNLAQEKEVGARPFFRMVKARDLIGWQYEQDDGGVERLTQVRFVECRQEKHGKYGLKEVRYVRVINAPAGDGSLGTWELYSDGSEGWTKKASGTHTYPGVPLVTLYTKRKGYMLAEPPMRDLAWTNLAHWQSSSDQRNILRFGRIGMLGMTGITQEQMDKPVTIAPNATLKSVNPNAKFFYVEPSGGAIQAGERDLDKLEAHMEVLGSQPLVERTTAGTATGKSLDESNKETTIKSWLRALESCLLEAYKVAATWIGVEIPDDFSIDVFSDFGITIANAGDLDFLLKARQAGDLSRLTFLQEIQRRGVLDEDVDPEQEAKDAEADAPPMLPPFGAPPGFPPKGGPKGGDPDNPSPPRPPVPPIAGGSGAGA